MVFSSISCLEKSDNDARTEAIELAEIKQLLLTLEMNGYDIDTTASGVYYIIHKEGVGPHVKPYDTIIIAYEGYLTNGVLFEASTNWSANGKWEFVYMHQGLFQGFNDGIPVMAEGNEVEFIILPKLAY